MPNSSCKAAPILASETPSVAFFFPERGRFVSRNNFRSAWTTPASEEGRILCYLETLIRTCNLDSAAKPFRKLFQIHILDSGIAWQIKQSLIYAPKRFSPDCPPTKNNPIRRKKKQVHPTASNIHQLSQMEEKKMNWLIGVSSIKKLLIIHPLYHLVNAFHMAFLRCSELTLSCQHINSVDWQIIKHHYYWGNFK